VLKGFFMQSEDSTDDRTFDFVQALSLASYVPSDLSPRNQAASASSSDRTPPTNPEMTKSIGRASRPISSTYPTMTQASKSSFLPATAKVGTMSPNPNTGLKPGMSAFSPFFTFFHLFSLLLSNI
jgi:hypothetical protein